MRDIEGRYPFLNSSMIMVAPARGYNCYWRMPFHSHCKITITNIGVEKQILYYVVAGKRKKQPENIGYFMLLTDKNTRYKRVVHIQSSIRSTVEENLLE